MNLLAQSIAMDWPVLLPNLSMFNTGSSRSNQQIFFLQKE